MADKFEKFTEGARKSLTLAQEEAHRFGHNYIGTEHILLGLVREGDGVAARVLANMGVQLSEVRQAIEHIIGRGDSMVVGEISLTPRAKKVIELAVDEARRLNHHYIGTEHLLLGLLREGNGVAAGVLEGMGVRLDAVREQVLQVVSQGGAPRHSEPVQPAHRRQPSPPLGDVRRVLAVNQTQVIEGVEATILSLEIYEQGIVIHGRLREMDPTFVGTRGDMRIRLQGIVLSDDLGTTYQLERNAFGHPDLDSSYFRTHFTSGLADGAHTLRINLDTAPETEPKPLHRQWQFEVEL